mgnify:FL=1
MPWIDAGALKEKYADQLSVQRVFGYDAGFVAGILAALEMPTLSPPNEPLTLDELREMDGEPVWCKWLLPEDKAIEQGKWFIVISGDKAGLEIKRPAEYGYHFCKIDDYGKTWLAYRRPPEGEEERHGD